MPLVDWHEVGYHGICVGVMNSRECSVFYSYVTVKHEAPIAQTECACVYIPYYVSMKQQSTVLAVAGYIYMAMFMVVVA